MAPKQDRTMTTVQLPKELWERWRRRLPKYGDRSEVLRRLIEKFVNGEVDVILPPRRI